MISPMWRTEQAASQIRKGRRSYKLTDRRSSAVTRVPSNAANHVSRFAESPNSERTKSDFQHLKTSGSGSGSVENTILTKTLDGALLAIQKVLDTEAGKKGKRAPGRSAPASSVDVEQVLPPKTVSFKACSSSENLIKVAHLPGRSLADYLALPLDAYSMLDPRWIRRDDMQPGLFHLVVPLQELGGLPEILGLPLDPQISIAVEVDEENEQVRFRANRLAFGAPHSDKNFKLNLTAVLRSQSVPDVQALPASDFWRTTPSTRRSQRVDQRDPPGRWADQRDPQSSRSDQQDPKGSRADQRDPQSSRVDQRDTQYGQAGQESSGSLPTATARAGVLLRAGGGAGDGLGTSGVMVTVTMQDSVMAASDPASNLVPEVDGAVWLDGTSACLIEMNIQLGMEPYGEEEEAEEAQLVQPEGQPGDKTQLLQRTDSAISLSAAAASISGECDLFMPPPPPPPWGLKGVGEEATHAVSGSLRHGRSRGGLSCSTSDCGNGSRDDSRGTSSGRFSSGGDVSCGVEGADDVPGFSRAEGGGRSSRSGSDVRGFARAEDGGSSCEGTDNVRGFSGAEFGSRSSDGADGERRFSRAEGGGRSSEGADEEGGSSRAGGGGGLVVDSSAVLVCKVEVELEVQVPHPLSAAPRPLLNLAATLVTKFTIEQLLPGFVHLISLDYERWASGETRHPSDGAGSLLSRASSGGGGRSRSPLGSMMAGNK